MTSHSVRRENGGTVIKLHRGENMTLIGMDLATDRIDDSFVGFSIEFREPGDTRWKRVWNRLQFSYAGLSEAERKKGAPSTLAPIQKYRWIHLPFAPKDGVYAYRVTPQFMRTDGVLTPGTSAEAEIQCSDTTVPGLLDIGFTRGFASSQAYANTERFPCQGSILPVTRAPADILDHELSGCAVEYDWLGFESRKDIYAVLDEAIADTGITVDALIYELSEPAIAARLVKLGSRLRAVIDDHGGHAAADAAETVAAARLSAAGATVRRTKFARQQHNKVFVLRRNGTPFKVLGGSTNFSMRGLYVQSNNTLVFSEARIAGLFASYFDLCFEAAGKPRGAATHVREDPLSQQWHEVAIAPDRRVRIAFSPHADPKLSLSPVAKAIDEAKSSVLYAMVFLNQLTGEVRRALDDLMLRSTFSYGMSQRRGGLALLKPDGRRGLVSFAYLGQNAPEPFAAEWSSGAGGESRSNVLHHKFVVVDFDTPDCKVFTGSSNMAAGGENENGDHLIWIEDPRVATAYAVEALRIFDHYHFRLSVREADGRQEEIRLKKPPASGEAPWFHEYYLPGHVKEDDRRLFSR